MKLKNNKLNLSLGIKGLIILLSLLVNVLLFICIQKLMQFSLVSQPLFVALNVVVMVVLLLFNFFVVRCVKISSKKAICVMSVVILCMTSLSVYANNVVNEVSDSINKIIVSDTHTQVLETAFVVSEENKDLNIYDLKHLKVGVLSNHQDLLGYELPTNELKTKNIEVEYIEYENGIEQLKALFAKEVTAVAMPSNYKVLYEGQGLFNESLDSSVAIYTCQTSIDVQLDNKSVAIDVTEEPFTVLIIGMDEGLSDALMLVSVNPISLKVTMTSIPRDMYVPIANGYGGSDKIAHARATDLQCTIDTVEDLLSVNIDFFVETNFNGVVSIVDALGGIVVNNPYEFVGQSSSSERGHYTVWVPSGENVPLNGEQTLAFARERKLYASGDFQRQENQQQVIEALMNKTLGIRDINQALEVLEVTAENISTNMSIDQILSLFNLVMNKKNNTSVQKEHLIEMVGTNISGYFSTVWNEYSQIDLSIILPYEASIKENRNMIVENLDLQREIETPEPTSFNVNWSYSTPY